MHPDASIERLHKPRRVAYGGGKFCLQPMLLPYAEAKLLVQFANHSVPSTAFWKMSMTYRAKMELIPDPAVKK